MTHDYLTGYDAGHRAGTVEVPGLEKRAYEAGQKTNQDLLDSLRIHLRESETEKLQLRQAVKDLTASSEKLRQINQKATKKALAQQEAIKEWQEAAVSIDRGRAVLLDEIDSLRKQLAELQKPRYADPYSLSTGDLWLAAQEISRLQTELTRTAAQLKASGEENRKFEQQLGAIGNLLAPYRLGPNGGFLIPHPDEIERLHLEADRLKREKVEQQQALQMERQERQHWANKFQEQCKRSEKIKQDLNVAQAALRNVAKRNADLNEESGLPSAAHEKVRQILFSAGDLFAGHPVTKIGLDP